MLITRKKSAKVGIWDVIFCQLKSTNPSLASAATYNIHIPHSHMLQFAQYL